MKKYAVVGLGYVGLGLATALSKKYAVIGYDINKERIEELCDYVDRNNLITKDQLCNKNLSYTSHLDDIRVADFYIVSVATPAYHYEVPNLHPLISATKDVGSVIKKGDIIVFESTVYPGTTVDICIPILEEISHLKHGVDFHVGYSPERISPGDKNYELHNSTKIISAQNEEILKVIQNTYESICGAVYPISSIGAAEAAKLLENTQRDVNIALMNEFSKIMHALDLNMHEIIAAASTKKGFTPYKPGFVGGHCISIDPHYLAFVAKQRGVQPELTLAARRVNDGMTQFVIQSMMKLIFNHHIDTETEHFSVGVFGISYKENVPDMRNSLAIKLLKEIRSYGLRCRAHDPVVSEAPLKVQLEEFDALDDLSVAIIVVGHDFYREVGLGELLKKCKKPPIIMDIPNLFIDEYKQYGDLIYWSL